ncbi:MAG: family 43 glycosylhydrolase [Marinilabiliaceae bacterium]|nr:family 43 glycosylhydrolase [Marinilabiliaceae bacterium]
MKFISILFLACLFLVACNKPNTAVKTTENYFQNPVLGGDYPDPSVLRVGDDYYMTHSSFDYYPGLLIWHSTDLVNWHRVTHALNKYVGSVWAPDLIKHVKSYYIYFPAGGKIWAVTAGSPKGPWSDPIDLNLTGFIDPGHVVDEQGNRHLYLSKGYIIRLSEDGLSTIGKPVKNYSGWEYPENWNTECFCLESPKSTVKDGYYHLIVAEGGTAGPATSHMVVDARSKSPFGPFENSPYNPIIHTESRDELWWSQGHGTLVDDVNGNWWMMYHGYENGFHTLGRQTLMIPIEWTRDNWFKVPDSLKSEDKLSLPAGKLSVHNVSLSDDFEGDQLGLQWQFFKLFEPERAVVSNGELTMFAKGNSFDDSSPLLVNSSDRKYEVQVSYIIDEKTAAGLCLFYNEKGNVRVEVSTERIKVYNQQRVKVNIKNKFGNNGFLKIKNDSNEVSFYVSQNGEKWVKLERSIETSGFNHNVFGEFLSLRAGVFAFGEGCVIYDDFKYKSQTCNK